MTTQKLTTLTTALTSREIAELTGKEHKNVIRDIKDQLFSQLYGVELDGSVLSHKQIQGLTVIRDERGYISMIHLDREHSMTLVSGYDVNARHAIIKRWQELEAKQPALSPMEMVIASAQAYLRLEQEQKRLETKIDALAEKVEEPNRETIVTTSTTSIRPMTRTTARATRLKRNQGRVMSNTLPSGMGGWQPIASAPKNNALIVAIKSYPYMYFARFRKGGLGEPQPDELAWRCESSGRFSHPTHWMLPPQAPEGVRVIPRRDAHPD